MGIDDDSDIAANLQIGPTTLGMVRIYVEGEGFSLPLDFDPDEAEEIAEELQAAAIAARARAPRKGGKGGKGTQGAANGAGRRKGRGPVRGRTG